MKTQQIQYLKEPFLKFGYGQKVVDPRDGLTLFGPFDKGEVSDFSVGIIGTKTGIRRCQEWLLKINKPVIHPIKDIAKPFFPGFNEVFHISMNMKSIPQIEINEQVLDTLCKYDDNRVRVFEIVDLYINNLLEYLHCAERIPKLWFVIIPDQIYTVCRPNSTVPKAGAIHVGIKDAYSRVVPGMFESEEVVRWRQAYFYENHFHNQLKIKLLEHKILTQIIREGTIAFQEYSHLSDKTKEQKQKQETAIAWNLATTMYYKIGGIPWKLATIRKDVCYIGLTFKQDETHKDTKYACCAAQMFLDSGDGIVFRGQVGPYYNPSTKEYHLTRERAKELLSKVLESFYKQNDDNFPLQIFIHGKTTFNDEEWKGFEDAVENKNSKLIGVRITHEKTFKLFRAEDFPIFRGALYVKNQYSAYLWTKGFLPRIQSILGLETPNPLLVEVIRGKENIEQVCADVLSLTKLNYNACLYCDGTPVTLKFADAIGEILTAGPNNDLEVLPFMYYI